MKPNRAAYLVAKALRQSQPQQALLGLVSALFTVDNMTQKLNEQEIQRWIEQAYALAQQLIQQDIASANQTDEITTFNEALYQLYWPDCNHLFIAAERTFAICCAIYFYRRLLVASPPAHDLIEEIEIACIDPLYCAINAAFIHGTEQQCIELAHQYFTLTQPQNRQRWLEYLPEFADRLDAYSLNIHTTMAKAYACIGELNQAFDCLSHCQTLNLNEPQRSEVKLIEAYVYKCDNNNQQAIAVLRQLVAQKQLSEHSLLMASLWLIELQNSNTSDINAAYKVLFQGASEAQQQRLWTLISLEAEQTLNDKQRQEKHHLVSAALSDENIAKVIQSTGSAYLGNQLRQYRDNEITPRLYLPSDITFEHCQGQIEKAIQSGQPNEIDRELKYLGHLLTQQSEQHKVVDEQQVAWYLNLIIASNDLELLLNQAEFFVVILSALTRRQLQPLGSILQCLFSQLIRLISNHSSTLSPEQQRRQVALRKTSIDNLLILLAELSLQLPQSDNLLVALCQLKRFWDFNGLNAQLKQKLYQYKTRLDQQSLQQIATLTQMLATVTRSKSLREQQKIAAEQLLECLMPLRTIQTQQSFESEDLYPELLLLDAPNGITQDTLAVLPVFKSNGRILRSAHMTNIAIAHIQQLMTHLHQWSGDSDKAYSEQLKALGEPLSHKLPKILLFDPPMVLGVRSTGDLQPLPLEVLPVPAPLKGLTQSKWLGEFITTALLTGANAALSYVTKPMDINNIAIFADPFFARSFTRVRLTSSADEAHTIAAIAAQQKMAVTLYLRGRANRANFLALDGQNAPTVLHIATHGISEPKQAQLSKLLLSYIDEQGQHHTAAIGFYDICLMDLSRTQLVVLAACSTHHGSPIKGESVSSIAWAFKAAGVKAVIATRWAVKDKLSILFWQVFYQHLLSGAAIAQSLTKARLTFIRSEKWQHPKFWAGYQLIV